MLFETFGCSSTGCRVTPATPRLFSDWLVTFAIMAGGALLLRDAMFGRSYPWSQGKVSFGAALLWVATIRARNGIARMVHGRETVMPWGGSCRGSTARSSWRWCGFPGWRSAGTRFRVRTAPRGTRGARTSATSRYAQFCVLLWALIPWAIRVAAGVFGLRHMVLPAERAAPGAATPSHLARPRRQPASGSSALSQRTTRVRRGR